MTTKSKNAKAPVCPIPRDARVGDFMRLKKSGLVPIFKIDRVGDYGYETATGDIRYVRPTGHRLDPDDFDNHCIEFIAADPTAEIAALRSELSDERERHRIALVQRDDYRQQLAVSAAALDGARQGYREEIARIAGERDDLRRQLDAERAEVGRLRHEVGHCMDRCRDLCVDPESMRQMTAERDAALAAVGEAKRCLAFFRSVIMCGEPWTDLCQREFDRVCAADQQRGDGMGEVGK